MFEYLKRQPTMYTNDMLGLWCMKTCSNIQKTLFLLALSLFDPHPCSPKRLFHRMSFLARKKRLDHDQDRFELRATASLQWMAAMVQHSTAISLTYAKVILAPVFRLVNSEKREVSNTLRWVNNDGVVLACGVLGVF